MHKHKQAKIVNFLGFNSEVVEENLLLHFQVPSTECLLHVLLMQWLVNPIKVGKDPLVLVDVAGQVARPFKVRW